MTLFLASLAGIPPFGIWIAKLQAFKTLLDAGGSAAYTLAVIAAVNTVIAAAYYMKILREMWMKPVPDGDITPIDTPQPIWAALGICAAGTVVLGLLPGLVLRFADLATSPTPSAADRGGPVSAIAAFRLTAHSPSCSGSSRRLRSRNRSRLRRRTADLA